MSPRVKNQWKKARKILQKKEPMERGEEELSKEEPIKKFPSQLILFYFLSFTQWKAPKDQSEPSIQIGGKFPKVSDYTSMS